uniref:Uncharacterized protein n=1 Tax=Lepeophtheirus salmonis TaxID=72036 RepID=A0A0K2TVF4_LEPSM
MQVIIKKCVSVVFFSFIFFYFL